MNGEKRNAYTYDIGWETRRPKRRRVDNIKIDLTEIG
jgi:hypothetical protein